MSTSTRETPVRYGAKYLDDAQLAAQQAAIANVSVSIYGSKYGAPETPAAPVDPPKDPADAFSVKQAEKLLGKAALAANPDGFAEVLKAEVARDVPRRSVLELLLAGAEQLEKTEEAALIAATIAALPA